MLLRLIIYSQNLLNSFYHNIRLKSLRFSLIGNNVSISKGFNFVYPHNISIGNNVYIGSNVNIMAYGNVIIANGVIIGPKLTIYTANHNFKSEIEAIPYDAKLDIRDVIIDENVWIGGNVVIVPGVRIGEGSIIGAGSVVVKNVPPFAIVGGNPAKIINYRDRDLYLKLKKENKIYFKLKNEGYWK